MARAYRGMRESRRGTLVGVLITKRDCETREENMEEGNGRMRQRQSAGATRDSPPDVCVSSPHLAWRKRLSLDAHGCECLTQSCEDEYDARRLHVERAIVHEADEARRHATQIRRRRGGVLVQVTHETVEVGIAVVPPE